MLVEKLNQFSVSDQKQMLEDAIMNSWKSVYPPKQFSKQQANKTPSNVVFDKDYYSAENMDISNFFPEQSSQPADPMDFFPDQSHAEKQQGGAL